MEARKHPPAPLLRMCVFRAGVPVKPDPTQSAPAPAPRWRASQAMLPPNAPQVRADHPRHQQRQPHQHRQAPGRDSADRNADAPRTAHAPMTPDAHNLPHLVSGRTRLRQGSRATASAARAQPKRARQTRPTRDRHAATLPAPRRHPPTESRRWTASSCTNPSRLSASKTAK